MLKLLLTGHPMKLTNGLVVVEEEDFGHLDLTDTSYTETKLDQTNGKEAHGLMLYPPKHLTMLPLV